MKIRRMMTLLMLLTCLSACGGGGGGSSAPPTGVQKLLVTGTASQGVPLVGTAYLKDAKGSEISSTIGSDGSFTFDVTNLTAPYVLKAGAYYSFESAPGVANINPLTNLAVTMANNGNDVATFYSNPTSSGLNNISANLSAAVSNIQAQLAPLLALYSATSTNFITAPYKADGTGVDKIFEDVTITVHTANVNVINKVSGDTILAGNINGASITGQINSSNLPAPPAAINYSISGSVTSSNNAALTGVTVTLSGARTMSTTTDSSGHYSFDGLSNGSYGVSVSSTSYSFSSSQNVTLNNANITGLNFTGSPVQPTTYTISGTIISAAGSGLSGITVGLSGAGSATTSTDGNGSFAFNVNAPGTYTLTASSNVYSFSPGTITVNITGANAQNQSFIATLIPPPTYILSGIITNNNTPISGVNVTLSGPSTATITTDSKGAFAFTGLLSGTYTLTPSLTNYAFTPSSTNVTINNSNSSSVSFTGTNNGTLTVNLIWGKTGSISFSW